MNPVLHQASKEGRAGAAPATRLLNLQLAEAEYVNAALADLRTHRAVVAAMAMGGGKTPTGN